jgi:hypothetical protein
MTSLLHTPLKQMASPHVPVGRLHRKYDSSGNADRSGTGCYPDAYIQALLCRAVAASRGPGSAEAYERAKSKGFRSTFQGVFRPKVLNLR